ncbi:FkbM family methyltransferase [Thiobacillus sp.]|uniref:FkbM family methyltransferase n=1 Tax=Thiobacillus sp. TaxID=924 RepID=UPI0025F55304|nr:FkbM family methyltransferase [Thiobacillus sp.]
MRGDPKMARQTCYGQDGEDLILDRFLEHQRNGFYVDVGAHHPVRFSNTYLFYRRGWRGLNIDAEPGSMRLFKKLRRRDINIECGVAGRGGLMTYFRFNEPALNTFEEGEARLKDKPPYKIIEQVEVPVRRLDDLLDQYMPPGQKIDFMTVDVEGKDYEVLASNDWQRFRPRYILAETLRTDMLHLAECPVVRLLGGVGYIPVAKTYNTTFFASGDTA